MDKFLRAAIDQAKKSSSEGGIPIGSVIVHKGKILGKGHNLRVQNGSVILHGEMAAFENAGRQPASIYRESIIYTTLSPCAMCAGTIVLYGIPKLIIGENETFLGAEEYLKKQGVEVEVINDAECIHIMTEFIQKNPELWNEDIGEPIAD